jgi:hypothetical protein
MKFKMFLLSALLLFIVVGMPMLLPGPDGKPLMKLSDWVPTASSLSTVPSQFSRFFGNLKNFVEEGAQGLESLAGDSTSTESGKLFKWKDKQGQWHFTDTPGVDAVSQFEIDLPEVANVVEPPPHIPERKLSAPSGSSIPGGLPLPTTISPADIPKLIDNAKNVQGLMDQRSEQLKKMLEK